jgi:hypothetical protein
MRNAVAQLAAGKLSSFLTMMAPPEGLEQMRTQWEAMRRRPIDEADDARFRSFMGMLTAEGAEQTLFMMIKPELAEAQQQMQMLTAMAPMMAAGALQEASAPEQAMELVQSMARTLSTLDIGSEDKAREAIAIVCSAARELDLPDGAAMQALDFEEGLAKVDVVYGATTGVMAVYGITLDEIFDSMEIRTALVEGDSAQLEMGMKVFGIDVDPFPVPLERIDGRWSFPSTAPVGDRAPQGLAR